MSDRLTEIRNSLAVDGWSIEDAYAATEREIERLSCENSELKYSIKYWKNCSEQGIDNTGREHNRYMELRKVLEHIKAHPHDYDYWRGDIDKVLANEQNPDFEKCPECGVPSWVGCTHTDGR